MWLFFTEKPPSQSLGPVYLQGKCFNGRLFRLYTTLWTLLVPTAFAIQLYLLLQKGISLTEAKWTDLVPPDLFNNWQYWTVLLLLFLFGNVAEKEYFRKKVNGIVSQAPLSYAAGNTGLPLLSVDQTCS